MNNTSERMITYLYDNWKYCAFSLSDKMTPSTCISKDACETLAIDINMASADDNSAYDYIFKIILIGDADVGKVWIIEKKVG